MGNSQVEISQLIYKVRLRGICKNTRLFFVCFYLFLLFSFGCVGSSLLHAGFL